MSLDFAYIKTHIPVMGDIQQVILAVGWALLLGNLVFQALRSMASGLSNQYISRADLGELSPTPRLEEKLGAAVETVIGQRCERLGPLERSFTACKVRLLQMEGGEPGE